jgi:transcriptional regulator with XRE-family HTH domain
MTAHNAARILSHHSRPVKLKRTFSVFWFIWTSMQFGEFRSCMRTGILLPGFSLKEVGEPGSPIKTMEWEADRILALRKYAGMTQAQIAQWLGVTIKQVKYLEHQRRNPSGPTRRLLDILATELSFDSGLPVQVLGASAVRNPVSKQMAPNHDLPSANSKSVESVVDSTIMAPASERPIPQPESAAERGADGGAFVWQ